MSHPTVRTALLLGLMSGILLALGSLLGGSQGLVVAFGFAVALNFFSYWFSDRVVLAMYRARQVGPDHPLHAMVAALALRAGLPLPRVYLIPSDAANAFATGRNPQHAAVAATEGILRVLERNELEGVLAHELAHVKHRDILISSIAATLAAAIMMVGRMAMFAGHRADDDDGHMNAIAAVLMMVLAPIAAMLIQAAISRSREFAADAGGAALTGNPHGLAGALRKIEAAAHQQPLAANPATAHMFIVKPFAGKSLLNLFSTHPPTEQRISRLLGTALPRG